MSTADELLRHSEEEARLILRKRRRTNRTSCYPCRSRKVRCDKELPCNTCVKRGYPELCSFVDLTKESAGPSSVSENLPSQPIVHHNVSTSSSQVVSDRDVPRDSDPVGIASLPGDIQSDTETATGIESVSGVRRDAFLGSNSMPSFLRQQESQENSSQNTPSRTVEVAILPILGFENSRTSPYPFLPTSRTSTDSSNLEHMLPVDHEVISLFQCYRLESHPFSPIIPDIENFEDELCRFLDDRNAGKKSSAAQCQSETQSRTRKQSDSWIGSLFAVLASGAQYSSLPHDERQAKAKLYVQNSFQCLRMANFLARPSLLCLQTLLILGNVLQNDMQPEAAWILLGTTGRVAQSLGLHQERKEASPESSESGRLWQAVLWQDSLLSLCFDRSPISTAALVDTEPSITLSYTESMQALSNETLKHLGRKTTSQVSDYAILSDSVSQIEAIEHRSTINASGTDSHISIQQRCEMYTLRLHISFVLAWVCRPALRSSPNWEVPAILRQQLIEKCHDNLINCVRAFVQLRTMRALASRSWTILHNGLSSALLMSLLNFGPKSAEVRQLQGEIIETLSSETNDTGAQNRDLHGDIKLSGPHARILTVLKKLHQDHTGNPQMQPNVPVSARLPQSNTDVTLPSEISSVLDAGIERGMDPVWLMSPTNVGQVDVSPLDYFDSLLWDPVDNENTMQDQVCGFPGPWMS